MQLLKLKKISENELLLLWSDNTETKITLRHLRDECPCAECKGETVLFKAVPPSKPTVEIPGMYELKKVDLVGNYSLQPTWGDGHNTGLYSWDYLRHISTPSHNCQCGHSH